MADVFNEVEEQLRSARYADLARRGWPYAAAALAAALLVALGAWGWSAHLQSQDAAASRDYAQALAALDRRDTAAADAAFGRVASEGRAGYRALALMQQAALRLQARKPDAAVALFDQAAKADSDPAVADAAALKAAYVAMNTAPLAQTQSRLQPLLAAGRPYRSMAREALAMAKLAAGRNADARSDFQLLALQQDASDDARARAHAAVAMIDSGAAAAVPPAVKAEAASPPPPFLPPSSGGAGPAQ